MRILIHNASFGSSLQRMASWHYGKWNSWSWTGRTACVGISSAAWTQSVLAMCTTQQSSHCEVKQLSRALYLPSWHYWPLISREESMDLHCAHLVIWPFGRHLCSKSNIFTCKISIYCYMGFKWGSNKILCICCLNIWGSCNSFYFSEKQNFESEIVKGIFHTHQCPLARNLNFLS